VWQNNKKSNNRFSGMIRNISGDYISPLYRCLNNKNNGKDLIRLYNKDKQTNGPLYRSVTYII
jgi:molybdopterin/thiamine biosynthesis adenylyltransferase